MLTLNQLFKKKRILSINKVIAKQPQYKGICQKIFTLSPKKPNSAVRKIAKIKLTSGKIILAYIMGEGYCIQEHNFVLIRGGKTKDLPGLKYKIIRGALDASGVVNRKTSRSKYGVKNKN